MCRRHIVIARRRNLNLRLDVDLLVLEDLQRHAVVVVLDVLLAAQGAEILVPGQRPPGDDGVVVDALVMPVRRGHVAGVVGLSGSRPMGRCQSEGEAHCSPQEGDVRDDERRGGLADVPVCPGAGEWRCETVVFIGDGGADLGSVAC